MADSDKIIEEEVQETKKNKVSWIYGLKKAELQEELENRGLTTHGTVQILKKRLRAALVGSEGETDLGEDEEEKIKETEKDTDKIEKQENIIEKEKVNPAEDNEDASSESSDYEDDKSPRRSKRLQKERKKLEKERTQIRDKERHLEPRVTVIERDTQRTPSPRRPTKIADVQIDPIVTDRLIKEIREQRNKKPRVLNTDPRIDHYYSPRKIDTRYRQEWEKLEESKEIKDLKEENRRKERELEELRRMIAENRERERRKELEEKQELEEKARYWRRRQDDDNYIHNKRDLEEGRYFPRRRISQCWYDRPGRAYEDDRDRPGRDYRERRDYYEPERYRRDYYLDDRRPNPAEVIRRWNLQYDGQENVMNFIERVEELAYSAQLSDQELLDGVPLMLKGEGIQWYRNHAKGWRLWEEFLQDLIKYFLPIDDRYQLEEEIKERVQKPGERVRTYITELETMIRRHGRFTEREKLLRLYSNMRVEYRSYFRRDEVTSVSKLLELATNYEMDVLRLGRSSLPAVEATSKKEKKKQEEKPKKIAEIAALEQYDRKTCCFRCGKKGHRAPQCSNPWVKFCSFCGKNDTLTRDCKCEKPQWWIERRPASEQKVVPAPAPASTVQVAAPAENTTKPAVPTNTPSTSAAPANQVNTLMKLDNRVYLNLEIDGHKYMALADTGAIRSYISTETWGLIQGRNSSRTLNATNHSVTVADGRNAIITGKASLDVVIERAPVQAEFFIMEGLKAAIIIGVDLMQKIRLGIRFEPEEKIVKEDCHLLDTVGLTLLNETCNETDSVKENADNEHENEEPETEPGSEGSSDSEPEDTVDLYTMEEPEIQSLEYQETLKNIQEEFEKFKEVKGLTRLIKHKITLKVEAETPYLGHIVGRFGIRTDPEKIRAIVELLEPVDVKSLRRFIGMISWYRRFIPNCSAVMSSWARLLGKKVKWKWKESEQEAFDTLKKKLVEAPVLAPPNFDLTFVLQTDASIEGLGAVQTQKSADGNSWKLCVPGPKRE